MNHEFFMQVAIDEARKAWGKTHPNPMVGAIVVDERGNILSKGYHHQVGQPHAEPNALNPLEGKDLSESTLYVTLEPCCTHGRTPPCTERIKRAGVRRVVIGCLDPNPLHAGRAVPILEAEGIDVITGILEEECRDLNLIFNHAIQYNRPLIALKTAITLDGKIATATGHSKWITNEKSRQDVMRWRRYFPAIAVGSGTVLADNPSLTSRIPNEDTFCPTRILFDRRLRTLKKVDELNVYSDKFAAKTIVLTSPSALKKCPKSSLAMQQDRGIELLPLLDETKSNLGQALQECGQEKKINGVYIEGGSHIVESLLREACVDYLFCYQAPKIIGDSNALSAFTGRDCQRMGDALKLREVQQAYFDGDTLIRGFLES